MSDTPSLTIGTIVAQDYRAAHVLSSFGLDFCCGGKRTLSDACRAKGIDAAEVARAIDALDADVAAVRRSDASWRADELVTHIVGTHHRYVREAMPRISTYLGKLVAVHGSRHGELSHVAAHFAALSHDLTSHMFKEEQVLFPYISALASAAQRKSAAPPNMFGSVANPIRMMEMEHVAAGGELALLQQLTDQFTVPADGCATYQVCFEELQAFDADLRRHIHLENNVLFPQAVSLETALSTGVTDEGFMACRDSGEIPGI